VTTAALTLTAIADFPLIGPGDDLAAIVCNACDGSLRDGDVLVVAQKIVSKAEDRFVALDLVRPSRRARDFAARVDKDPRLVELILSESRSVLRYRPGVLIVVHRLGFVMANAGIDASNVGPEGDGRVLLLPRDPDESAARLRAAIRAREGVDVAVIVSDSVGRAWRNGTVGIALGAAGLPALLDLRGRADLFGRSLRSSQIGLADELAAAASLVQGQADEGTPAVLIRGLSVDGPPAPARALIRPREEDLFR